MFVCVRTAARPQASSDAPRGSVAPRATAPLPPSPASSAFAAYVQTLDTSTRLVAHVLHVHPLSPSLRFSAGELVTVDAATWWHEVQRQSIAFVQQRAAAPAAPHNAAHAWRVRAPETFDDVPDAMFTHHAAALFQHALYVILKTLESVNARHQHDDERVMRMLASVDDGVAVAAAHLLQRWVAEARATMASPVVNILLQPRTRGQRHPLHDHALLPSVPLRALLEATEWHCSVCARATRTTSTTTRSHGDGVSAVVYRCAACDFNLCRECLTRIPTGATARSTSPVPDLSRHATDRFFALLVPRLHPRARATVVIHIARELRRRVLDLYPHHFHGLVPFAQLFRDLVTSDPSAALALVQAPPASDSLDAVAWFPAFSRTWTMSLSTLLGPFLRVSTMLDGTHDLDAAVRAATGPNVVTGRFRAQWMDGFVEVRTILHALMRTLLADEQHPVVVDATLCWLALTLLTADPRRRLNYDAHERLDGMLVNLTTMLLAHTLPVLAKAQHTPSVIDARYHLSMEPVRVYAHKDLPDVSLHHDATVCMHAVDTELDDIGARDKASIARYHARQAQDADKDASTFYPHLSCHEGIVCDQCGCSHLHGVRYKCAFCGDMDLCSDCFEIFRSHQAATPDFCAMETKTVVHDLQHVFLRIASPIPVFAIKHFEPFPLEWLTQSKEENDSTDATRHELESASLVCCDCGDVVGPSRRSDDAFFKCVNCLSPRIVCAACLAREESGSDGNPNELHAPGHVYLVVTAPWRRRLPCTWPSVLEKLQFRRLLHPPVLLPRRRFSRDTEVFYMTLRYLHFGPLATLSRWLTMVKEIHELQALCACDEEQRAFEKRRRRRTRRDQDDAASPSLQHSAQYKTNQARLNEMRVKCAKMELHLLASTHVVEWVVFYARSCRWLLHFASAGASVSIDPLTAPLTCLSSTFRAFPEHFFFDLCDVVYLLGLEQLAYREFVHELDNIKPDGVNVMDEVVEPLLVMLTQLIVAPAVTKNPHLRVEALRALTTLVTFVSQGQQVHRRAGHGRLETILQRHELFSRWLLPGLLQFHADMDRYNRCNHGLALTRTVMSGDHMLWSFLPTRLSVTMLLRYLWHLPRQRESLVQAFHASPGPGSIATESHSSSTQHVVELVSGLWSDIAKLFDEATSKITTLRQLHDVLEESRGGHILVLPFRREMLDGYVAVNAKHLRLTMRFLVEALELTSWFASFVHDECSSSSPAAALRQLLLQPLLVEQAARIVSFLTASVATVQEEKAWSFSVHLLDESKVLLAHVIVLLVRYAGLSTSRLCSPTSFWKLVRSSGVMLERRIGDVETHVRWRLNALCTRLESDEYLGSTVEPGDVGKSQALWEKEASAMTTRALIRDATTHDRHVQNRFLATVATDGRFDLKLFVSGCRWLRSGEGGMDDATNEGDVFYLDASWVAQFIRAMEEAQAMIQAQEAVEAFVGEIPEHYVDPLLRTVMRDPVRLPSGNILDRPVLARHLLTASQQGGHTTDPFTREPLTMAMVQPCDALREEIHVYLRTKMEHFRNAGRDKELGAWGLGWDVDF
ncbi:hypothetical protein PsorP6_014909 [Peronosclerospora sorghi]|uniref:Uncharacterized protein n=1 Tax=Peronosclerospora sorghi TaxID=230839 RepID=A0ACC0VTC2_9STRA|nr:hypothetical protein PsorP6_014909 [Peronosclerospora sorghi]